jgi:glycerophosphoryl diester phosphodiesterase
LSAPGWLVAKPVAHRGLHDSGLHDSGLRDSGLGVIENTCAAALAAIAANCSIECDVQMSRDGEAFVFHDENLERLTATQGRLDGLDAKDIARVQLVGCAEFIPSLSDFLACVAGRTPLVVEIKSAFNGDMRLAERTASVVAHANGPIALKSFDPAIMAHLRAHRARLGLMQTPLGMVSEARFEPAEYPEIDAETRLNLMHFLYWPQTRPEFLSWCVHDLPHAVPHLLREALGVPVMAWTVRTPDDWARAALWADQAIFEGRAG